MIVRQIFLSLLIVGSILCKFEDGNGSTVDASAPKAYQGHHQGHQGNQGHQGHQGPKHGNTEDDCDKHCVKEEGVALVFGKMPTPISQGHRVWKDGKPSCECEFDSRRRFIQYVEDRAGITHKQFLDRHQKDPAGTREWLKKKGVTVFFLPDEEELISYLVEVRRDHESLKKNLSAGKIQEIEKRLIAIGEEKGKSSSSGKSGERGLKIDFIMQWGTMIFQAHFSNNVCFLNAPTHLLPFLRHSSVLFPLLRRLPNSPHSPL